MSSVCFVWARCHKIFMTNTNSCSLSDWTLSLKCILKATFTHSGANEKKQQRRQYILRYISMMRSKTLFLCTFKTVFCFFFLLRRHVCAKVCRRERVVFWECLSIVSLASTFCGHHSQYVRLNVQLKFYRRSV